jgi:glycosyltransferase involved in cell wall biosynthesis
MRVSVIGPAHPLRGGIAHHVYWLKQELTARGHSVQVISFRKLYPSILFPGTTEIDTSRLKLDAGASALLAPLNPLTWLRAIKAVKSFAPDVVVFEWWQPFFGPLAGTILRALGKSGFRCVMECHNVVPHEGSPIDRLLSKYAFSPVDYFIAHSRRDAEELGRIAADRPIKVSPLPTVEEFSAAETGARGGRTILFFGKVRKYKGLGVLLRAMPKVLSEVACELLIAGEFYEPVARYEQMISAMGIGESVRVMNRYVANEEVPAVFARADVLVLPYVSASQSGVARIAFSNGLPIIASKTGGLSDIIEEGVNGLFFEPGNSDDLARQIVAYFKNNLGPAFAEKIRASFGDACKIVEYIEAAKEKTVDAPALSYDQDAR